MRQFEKFQVSELDSYFEDAYARTARVTGPTRCPAPGRTGRAGGHRGAFRSGRQLGDHNMLPKDPSNAR